jgi:hypothetical protein
MVNVDVLAPVLSTATVAGLNEAETPNGKPEVPKVAVVPEPPELGVTVTV